MNKERTQYKRMQEFQQLYEIILNGEGTDEEHARFLDLLSKSENELVSREMLVNLARSIPDIPSDSATMPDEHQLAIIKESIFLTGRAMRSLPNKITRPVHRVHFLRTAWFRYAAVLLLIAGTATFLYKTYQQPPKETVHVPINQPTDIQPGGNRAILTLADGRQIVLDSAVNGTLAQQGNTKIVKLAMGSLAYEDKGHVGEVLYNTIGTPKGGMYQIVLPDGSKVWLNAASSIRFPTSFGKTRQVVVAGEVYFEIAEDKTRPFYVKSGNMEVQVLGTSFNINAYPDEPVTRTTLLEGRVKIIYGDAKALLVPGLQAITIHAVVGNEINTVVSNTEEVVAWKNGHFQFDGAELDQIMRQIARWYNVQIIYKGAKLTKHFSGKIPRTKKLSEVLNALEFAGTIHYSIEGNTVTVNP